MRICNLNANYFSYAFFAFTGYFGKAHLCLAERGIF